MLEWLDSKENAAKASQVYDSVTAGLQGFYRTKLLPIEKEHLFHQFYSPELTDADFASAPMILLMGQYSTGKTTFIRHLLQRDFPGMRIGPEPTTDRFVCVLHGESESTIPGNALVVDHELPFTQLSHFGNSFLSRLEASRLPSQVLEGLTLIDTPGVLSGEKQRIKRGYEFEAVVKWFADRVDMIILLFDVSKLDISDEFRRVIQATKGNDHKISILLNKADNVTTQQLMRVYGALMWSLGKVLDTPEVARVYVGSFWDQPLKNEKLRELFEQEEKDLYTRIAQLPRSASLRKVNDLIKRARLAKVHALLLDYFYQRMPTFFGHAKEQERMIQDLQNIYKEISVQKGIPLGDFPDPRMMQQILTPMDFSSFKPVDPAKLEALETLLTVDLPKLVQMIPEEVQDDSVVQAGALGVVTDQSFKGLTSTPPPAVASFQADFEAIGPKDGKITAQQARQKMVESHLPSNVLHRIWTLADVDKDGFLTLPEYALAMHLVQMKLDGEDLPATLPEEMLPEELR
ncbi:unnamed protein product [Durusdinium trenchii]